MIDKKILDGIDEQYRKDEQKGFELLKQWVEDYPKTQYATVDDALLIKLMQGLKLLGVNHIITPEDPNKCPSCGWVQGPVGDKGLSLFIHFGACTLCLYCSCQQEYDSIIENDHIAHCDCPESEFKENGERQWTKHDCSMLWNGFVKYYNEILEELKDV